MATAVLNAVVKKRQILTLPRYLELLTFVYTLSPRFARWLAQMGGPTAKITLDITNLKTQID